MEPHNLSLDIKGSLIVPDEANPGEVKKVVYQGTTPQFANYETNDGKPRQVREWVIPYDPKTTPQLKQREKLRRAVQAWFDSDQAQRETALATAIKKKVTLFMAFISDWIKASPPIEVLIWDYNSALWDTLPVGVWDGSTATWEAGAEPWDRASALWDNNTAFWDALQANQWDNFSTIWTN
jgi:hypothetical protein